MIDRHPRRGLRALAVTAILAVAMIAVPPVLASSGSSTDAGTQSVSGTETWASHGSGPANVAVTIDSAASPVDGNESLDGTVRDSTATSSAPGETETTNATRGSIVFDDQVVADSNRQEVVIDSVTSTEGGFVAIYNTTAGGSLDSVIGASTYLAADREHTNVRVDLDRAVSDSQTLTAVVHNDTNGNNVFDFDGGDVDGRLRQEGALVSDSATVRRQTPTPTPTATPTPTPTPTPFSSPTPTATVPPTPTRQSGLDCLTAEESEIRSRLDSLARQTMAALPAEVQSRAAGERIEIAVGDPNPAYFGAVVDENSTVRTVQSGRLDGPTVTAETDCRTIDRVTSAENPSDALRQSISRNEITWEGTTPGRDALLGYGSKGVQMSHIRSSREVGDALDALEGFVNGVLMR